MWTEKLSNVVLDRGCKRYAASEPHRRTHARTHKQNSQTKFSIEHTSVGLAHACPIINGFSQFVYNIIKHAVTYL